MSFYWFQNLRLNLNFAYWIVVSFLHRKGDLVTTVVVTADMCNLQAIQCSFVKGRSVVKVWGRGGMQGLFDRKMSCKRKQVSN